MPLKDRVTIISQKNFEKIVRLYGEVRSEDLERIVNNHIAVAMDEIEEDNAKSIR